MNGGDKLVILHVAFLNDNKSKGPNTNVPKNVIYGNKFADVGLYNLGGDKLAVNVPEGKFFTTKKYATINDLPTPFNRPDLVVFQGLYFINYCKIAKWLKKNNIPYIIVPRCSMTTAGIKSHALKKKVANKLFFNEFVANASSIQFLAKNEYLESKNNFKFKNYFILSNGVEIPKKHYAVKNRREFKIVFIGRYNIYHKGLDVLLESIKSHADWFKENCVVIDLYGSNSDDGLAYLKRFVENNRLENIVHIKGPVFGEEKEKALLDADVFIHTSRLEGQPTSVIEAISYGVPVMVTPGTNVADIVKENKLGFTTDLDQEEIYNLVKYVFGKKMDFKAISLNEISYAKKNLAWEKVAKDITNEYFKKAIR